MVNIVDHKMNIVGEGGRGRRRAGEGGGEDGGDVDLEEEEKEEMGVGELGCFPWYE